MEPAAEKFFFRIFLVKTKDHIKKLLNPKYFHEKEYIIRTSNKLRSNFKQKMEAGVNIEGYVTKKCTVKIINENSFRIILTEGKKHQIRRMCSALFQEIADQHGRTTLG